MDQKPIPTENKEKLVRIRLGTKSIPPWLPRKQSKQHKSQIQLLIDANFVLQDYNTKSKVKTAQQAVI
jgi:hypothetical protein